MNIDDLIAEFSGASDVYGSYINSLANGPLQKYKNIVHDRGVKKGEPLFTHVMSGIGVLARLAELLSLAEEETQVLMAAFTVHDLNKLPEFEDTQISFNKLTTPENIVTALEAVKMETFFPEWRDYLEDIGLLIRAHSGHHHTAGEMVIKHHDPYRLGRDAIHRLVPLIRAADVADLSRTLDERPQKAKVLLHLNQVSPDSYDFATHRIAEQRGLLTNLLHNEAQKFLEECGCAPLLFYPDGVAYLVPRGAVTFQSSDYPALARRFALAVEAKIAGGFADFIRATNQGIKIEAQCLDQGAEILWREVLQKIQGSLIARRVDNLISAMERRLQDRAKTDALAQALLDNNAHQLPADDVILRLGELARTYYIFLADHDSGKDKPDPWSRLYEMLGIPAEVYAQWTPLDPRYDRGYVVGQWLALQGETLFSIWPKLVQDAERLCGGQDKGDNSSATLTEYALRNITVSLAETPERDWGAGLRRYIANQHRQCSLCGSEFVTQEWMAADVPSKQKVQQFSNRLTAGMTREPKRYVCAVCRTQYLLDRLTFKTLDSSTRYFMHFYPYTFFTPDYLKSIRNFWEAQKGIGTESLLVKVSESWRQEEYPKVALAATKAYGTPIPKYSEVVGNIFTVPINAPGDNTTERFLYAMQSALLWKLFLGCRVALTESPEPPFGGEWRGDLFFDCVPTALRGLLSKNEFPAEDGQTLTKRIQALHKLTGIVFDAKRDYFVPLARSLAFDALEPFWVMNKLILRKADSSKASNTAFLRRDALPYLEQLVGKEETLSYIKRMAEIAWTGQLKGESLKDTALAKPLDAALAALAGYQKTTETDEDLRAVTTKEVEEAIERITDPKYWGKTKIGRVGEFVAVLFDGLLAEAYHGDLNALLTNKRRIRAAYLHYIAAQFRAKGEQKEETE